MPVSNFTFINLKTNTDSFYGMGDFEKALLSMFIIFIVGGVAFYFIGIEGAPVVILLNTKEGL